MKSLAWQIPVAMLLAGILGVFSAVAVIAFIVLIRMAIFLHVNVKNGRFKPMLPFHFIHFMLDFFWDLAISNFQLAWDVITPNDRHQVTMVEVPIDDLCEWEIALLSHRITLTPGTLACLVSEDLGHLLVHVMYPVERGLAEQLRRPIDILKGNAGRKK